MVSITDLLGEQTDFMFAMYLKDNSSKKIICYDNDKFLSVYYNSTIWERTTKNQIIPVIRTELYDLVRKDNKCAIEAIKDVKESIGLSKLFTLLYKKIGTYTFVESITKSYLQMIYDKSIVDKLDKIPYHINFKNGVYDIKNDSFRDRIETDYCSITLDYDYTKKYSHSRYNKLQKQQKNSQKP
jgi:phage/plasmid-associated DNA primase